MKITRLGHVMYVYTTKEGQRYLLVENVPPVRVSDGVAHFLDVKSVIHRVLGVDVQNVFD